jgi:hypothetical protein
MARKPNYGLNRSDVNRAKQAKQEEKQRLKEEAVARRRQARESGQDPGPEPEPELDTPGLEAAEPEAPRPGEEPTR